MQGPSPVTTAYLQQLGNEFDHLAVFLEVRRVATEDPEQLAPLLWGLATQIPRAGTFLEGGLGFVRLSDLPGLIELAVEELEKGDLREAAADCIAQCSLQVPHLLRPHLQKLFKLRPNAGSYYDSWPWRGAGEQERERLVRVFEAKGKDAEFAWECLLQSADANSLRGVLTLRPGRGSEFEEVGFTVEDDKLRELTPAGCFHLRFPRTYLEKFDPPAWRPKIGEPSWDLPDSGREAKLGGSLSVPCGACGSPLHRLLALPEIPDEIGVRSVERLEIPTCLSCLCWEHQRLCFQHSTEGAVRPIGVEPGQEPDFPSPPLEEVTVSLCPTPVRLLRQDWALSNDRENLNRVGGHPTWVQSADYPDCPLCQKKMPFLFQLDSLITTEGEEFLWGSGGIGYFFWCDPCRVSSGSWQCT